MPGFLKLQFAFGIISLLAPTLGYLLVISELSDPMLTSDISMLTLIGSWALMIALPFLLPSNGVDIRLKYTATIIFWGLITTVFPIIWDLTWAMFHGLVNGATENDKWLWYWWAYAVADTRFLNSDPLMIIVEYWSGILGFAQGYALYRFLKGDLKKAFIVSTIAGCLQFYGCSAFFGTQAMVGFVDIRPEPLNFWGKFIGLNGFWVIMPAVVGWMYWRLLQDGSFNLDEALRKLHKSP